MMKDSEDSKNAKMDVSKDAEWATKRGLGRRIMSHEQRREILNELFFEGEERMPYVKQFYSLLTIAALIAIVGLYGNSPAVVIGAMLLSPLMTPILAFSAALVMGWPVRSGRLAIRLLFATLFVFALSYLFPLVFRMPTNIVIPPELLARTNPNMGDLLIALSAGIAAALMLLRRETLAILPGVASASQGCYRMHKNTPWPGKPSYSMPQTLWESSSRQAPCCYSKDLSQRSKI